MEDNLRPIDNSDNHEANETEHISENNSSDEANQQKDCVDSDKASSKKDKKKRKQHTKIALAICIPIALAVNFAIILANFIFVPQFRYDKGIRALNSGNYEVAYEHFISAGKYQYSELYLACTLAAEGIYGNQQPKQQQTIYNGEIKNSTKAKEALNLAESIANSNRSSFSDDSYRLYQFLSGEYAYLSGDFETAKKYYSFVDGDYKYRGIRAVEREGAIALNGTWKLISYYGPDSNTGEMVSKSGYELNNFGRNDDEVGFVPLSEWEQKFNTTGGTWFEGYDFLFGSGARRLTEENNKLSKLLGRGRYEIKNSTQVGTDYIYTFSVGKGGGGWKSTVKGDIITIYAKTDDDQDKIYTLERI